MRTDESHIPVTDNVTLLLLPRFITFIFLFGGSIILLKSRLFVFELLFVYGVAALAYLSLLLLQKNTARAFLKRILIFHILLEVMISGIMVYHSGGNKSPLILLFILSIASASMIYQIRGALFAALLSTLSYLTAVYFNLVINNLSLSLFSFSRIVNENPGLFFSVSLHIVLFTAVGLMAGSIAERLKDRGLLLKTTEEELKNARRLTSDILEGMGSGLICIDYSGEILMMNRTARELLGMKSKHRIEGKISDKLKNGLYPLCEFLERTAISNLSSDLEEITITTGDGTKVPLGISTSLLSGPDPTPHGIIAVFQDLTEAKNLQQRLRVYDRLAAVGQLSAGIAHEIRNPLTSISGSVEVLQSELKLSGANQKLMNVVVKESQRLNKILSEFLLYSRIKPTLFTNVILKNIVNEVIDFISNDTRLKPGKSLFNSISDNAIVSGDEEKIRQILFNLIFNALDAVNTENGRIEICEGIDFGNRCFIVTGDFERQVRPLRESDKEKLSSTEEYICFSVCDNGSGIPGDRIEKIFQPFYSTRQGGSGLGLAIVQRLVESMDGIMIFQAVEGKRTTFSVYLKKYDPEQAANILFKDDAEHEAEPAVSF